MKPEGDVMKSSLRGLAVLMLMAFGCAGQSTVAGGRGTLITPSNQAGEAAWDEHEREAPLVMRNLRSSPEASTHVLRIRTQREPRVHQKSDLSLFVVAGELEVTVDGRPFKLNRGDVLEIPRATPYGLRNLGYDPSVAYLVFTPGHSDDDDKSAAAAPRDSSWRWNLWVQ
jgi:mannose-6-phosphate isomerase-like protein (cupin superfamily)